MSGDKGKGSVTTPCLRPFDTWVLVGTGYMIAYALMIDEVWMVPIFLFTIYRVVKLVNADHTKAA